MPKKRSQTTSFDVSFESSLIHHGDTIHKSYSTSDQDDRIPIPIQIFLWRQSNPFIKGKFGNLTEASAIVFDQVLVQNILHGLSPSLTDAILSIPRWLLIKAAFPHVMHACSSIIEHNLHAIHQSFPSTHSSSLLITASPSRSASILTQFPVPFNHQLSIPINPTILLRPSSTIINHSLNQIDIRLFHTLHYLLLYSNDDNNNNDQLLSLNIIQLFIYLFIPYIQTYLRNNEKEFLSNNNLIQGMRLIWQPLFEYHQPNIRIFNAFIKPILSSNDQQQHCSSITLIDSPVLPTEKFIIDKKPLLDLTNVNTKKELKSSTFILTDSDTTTTTTHDSPSDFEGYGIGNNMQTCAPLVHMNSICPVSDLTRSTVSPKSPDADKFRTISSSVSTSSTPCSPQVSNICPTNSKIHSSEYVLFATYFDIGIIRTLFSPSWLTDGYLWCLEYLHKRIINISNEIFTNTDLSSYYLKSLSMSQVNHIIDKQYIMTKTLFNSIKQRSTLLNKSCHSRNKIHYIDEDRIEHLDLSISSLKTTDFRRINPSLLLFKPLNTNNLDQSKTRNSSQSDSNINYKYLENQDSNEYINQNGTINLNIILAGIHAIICKENHLKICELIINILDILFNLNILLSIENEKFQLSIDIILRILKRLGCKNCQSRGRNFLSDQMREKIHLLLNKLRLINEKYFEKSFLNFITNGELIHIFDVLHALYGYCSASNMGLIHYAPYISNKNEIYSCQTYANNFDEQLKTIDSFILNLIFKSLITRLNHQLTIENITLYNECRAFLIYMKENHGGIFRLTMFSSLIDPEKQLKIIKDRSAMMNTHSKIRETQSTTESLPEINGHNLYVNHEENLYVDLSLVRMGLLRFNFLIESCPPGSLPDPEFLNSILFLDAPIISKAAFLIECAYFIRRCSLGQWPEWMRINVTTIRSPNDTLIGRINGNTNIKLNKIYQAAAARMFYLWGEALSSQLESILDIDEHHHQINDETFEDYYNEAIVNPSGHNCPYSLQLIVCLLLYEITRFLRESYETLPKLSSLLTSEIPSNRYQQRTNNSQSNIDKHSTDYLRMDSLVSQISNRSTISLTNEQSTILPTTISNMNERHISFAVNTENDSNESHHTTIVMNNNDDDGGNIGTTGSVKSKLFGRNSIKLRKPSVRMKDKNTHRSSVRTRRRSHVSILSTDTDGHQSNIGSSNLGSTEEYRNNNYHDEFDVNNNRLFPWIKIIIRIFNNMNIIYDEQVKTCQNLFKALINMYRLSSSIIIDKKQYFHLISIYLEKQFGSLIQIPLMILCKSSVLLDDEHYSQILCLSWQLLLDQNEELSSCAATIVILAAARAGQLVDRLIQTEMKNSSPLIRYNAILRFQILWRFRYQFWIRLEEHAHSMMKILPPSIEFVLPSSTLGIANLPIVDPPWMPHAKTLVQQVALNQIEVQAMVTTSKTRKKHQQELIHSALMTEEIGKQKARENCAMSTASMLQAASFEPLLYQSKDEEDEVHTDDDRTFETSVQIRQAQGAFPSTFIVAIFQLVEMLEDEEIIENGAIVSGAARQALWTCLVEEPNLLIRFFFEKLSHKERRIKSLQNLRHLMIYLIDIPSQFAHAIFNYILGLLLSMVRCPLDGSQELILIGLTLIWQIIPYLHGLNLKDFKQILRKEQAEMMILITGNIPSTKKLIIHGPDLTQIPTQAIISEDTQFSNVLQEALEFFGIPESKHNQYYLIDIKTRQIQIPDAYVRDFYFFRRNIYPQLSLIYLDTEQSQQQLEQISIYIKTMELSKVLFARYLIENTPMNQIHNSIQFFHDELLKSPLFPRKPLESDFNLYMKISNNELWNLDMLHKYNWIKLITCIFFNMDDKTTTIYDITLFLPVINGSFILHCEDLGMLRFCLATYINIVKHFRHIFATNGYLLIMPTILRVYSNIQSNPMLRKSIEYCCRQFFILHRIPFILQMLGSISQLLDIDEQADITDTNKIQPIYLFRLLIALEQINIDIMHDEYSILELVKKNSITRKLINTQVIAALGQGTMMNPLVIKSLDFCYADDETIFTLLNCFDVCVTVVAYAPDSVRSLQMLGIIDILLPKYFEYLKDLTTKNDIQKNGRNEIKIIEKLSIAIKTMINACESLTRTFVEPKCDIIAGGNYKYSRGSYRTPSIAPDDDSMNRLIDGRTRSRAQDADERKQASEFRWPRDTLLSIISTYIHFSSQRFKELNKLLNDPTLHFPELLDTKSHLRLIDIAHTLLKLSTFDTLTISCRGIQNYFQKLLPYIDWSQEQLRPILNLLFRRTDRMFLKICKKPMIKRCFDWEATARILNGIYLTIDRHPYIAYFPNLKTLISDCIGLILNENIIDSKLDISTFPKEFSQAIIKLVGRYLLAIKYQPNLEILTNNNCSSVNLNLTINHLLNFLLPLMFLVVSDRKDTLKFHSIDISYIITIIFNSIKTSSKLSTNTNVTTGKQYLTVGENLLLNNNITHKSMKLSKDLLQIASLLGLKILIISFNKQLKYEWQRIIQIIKFMCNKQLNISTNFLLFIDFIVSYKTPIYVILRPFLLHYIHSITSENDYEIITNIQQKLIFEQISPAKSIGKILHELLQELNQLKAQLTDEPRSSNAFDIEQITAKTSRFQRQQKVDDSSSNITFKNRTEQIQLNKALDILEPYYTRYTVSHTSTKQTSSLLSLITDERSATTPYLLSPMYSHNSMSLLRSVTVGSDRNSSSTSDRSFQHHNSMIDNTLEKTEPKLRTFRGWKRNTAHLDKSRLSQRLWLSDISSEPNVAYDATKEMNNIFQSVRQVNEQNFDQTCGLQSKN